MVSSTSELSSISVDGQRPTVHTAPDADETFGDLAAKLAAKYGLRPDEWQRFVLDDWLARKDGHWSALTCGLSVPRQNGKNALIEMRELFGAVMLGEKILHTAHEVKTAQKHFRRLQHFFGMCKNDPAAKYPELNALVERVRLVNGQEAILLENGGSIELIARSKNSGRGFTVDLLVLDEAQEMDEDAIEALMPTTSAAPLGDPQWIFTGTPPGPSALGHVFRRVRDEAVGENPGALAWAEWSAPEGTDLDDRDMWRAVNPAIAAGRLKLDVVAGERARFSSGGFKRERLGMWSVAVAGSRAIPDPAWKATAVDVAPAEGVKSFAVTFNMTGTRQAVAGALRHSDGVHLELVGTYEGPVEEGVQPLAEWLAARWKGTAMIAISGQAGAAPLVQALLDEGVPQHFIHVLSAPEYMSTGPLLITAITSRTVTHPAAGDDDPLEQSVAVSDKQFRGKSGGWAWRATTPDGDETPVEALGVALWASQNTKRVPGRRRSRKVIVRS